MVSWHANFRDGSRLDQFDSNGNEIPFGAVKKRFNGLKSLSISQVENQIPVGYEISLLDGMFIINGRCIYLLDTNIYPPKELKNIRPIYFERWQQDFNAVNGQSLGQKLLFTAIGFQAIFEGRNIKRYLEIYPSGDIKVRNK